MSPVRINRNADACKFVGADVHRTRKGYTLILHRKGGKYPVLGIDGREPEQWQDLDKALAYLVENFGVLSRIQLKLQDE